MPNSEHLEIVQQGVRTWNAWREDNPAIRPDLSEADLNGAALWGIDFSGANLRRSIFHDADIREATLVDADLSDADLRRTLVSRADARRAVLINLEGSESRWIGADLTGANLEGAELKFAYLSLVDFSGANLSRADLSNTSMFKAKLMNAELTGANLSESSLVEADFTGANVSDCNVYGTSVWNVNLTNTKQRNLRISAPAEPPITVDDLDVAQFIYLLLNNSKIRHVIDTITSKVVLILGRFTPERKAILDAIRDELRQRDYLPVLFDFEKPANRDVTETVSTLAHMARFVIADITDAKSIPQELMRIVPALPSVPVQPLLLASQREYGMFEHFRRYPWVLPMFEYTDEDHVVAALQTHVVGPAEAKAKEQTGK